MLTSDYYFTNIQPDPIIIPPHRGNNSSSTQQQAADKDPIPQKTDTLKPGKTKVYPSMLAEKLHHHISHRSSNSIAFIKLVFHRKRRSLTWQRTTLHRRRHPLITYQTVNLQMRNWIDAYAHLKKREFTTLLRDQFKPLKQHYHTLLLSVILQLKEDPIENQR